MASASTSNVETIAYVVHDAKGPYKLENVVLDEMRPDELLVDMQYSGICGTDIGVQQGHLKTVQFPAILGHEGTGKILAIGDKVKNKDLKVGDRVMLSINYCEECKFCKAQHPADCIHGTKLQ